MNMSLPLPSPTTDAQRAELAALLDRAATSINDTARGPTNGVAAEELEPLISELERFFARNDPPPEVARLLAWYHSQ